MLRRKVTGTPQSLRFFMIAPVVGAIELGDHLIAVEPALATIAAGFFVMGVFVLLERFDRGMTPFRRRCYRVALLFEAIALPPIMTQQGVPWFGLFLYPALFFALAGIEQADARRGPSREMTLRRRIEKRLVADAPIDITTLDDGSDEP